MSRLEELWSLAEPLGFLFIALHLPYPYFLRRALQCMIQPSGRGSDVR